MPLVSIRALMLDVKGVRNYQLRMPEVKYAGFWVRLVADLIDSTILNVLAWLVELMILGAVYWGMVLVKSRSGVAVGPFSDAFNSFWMQIFNVVIYLVLAAPYYIYGHFRYGTTPGKWPFKIFVVSHDGFKPVTFKQSYLRFAAYLLSYLPFGTGFLMAAYHPEKRALHDLLAGTVSIRKAKPASV